MLAITRLRSVMWFLLGYCFVVYFYIRRIFPLFVLVSVCFILLVFAWSFQSWNGPKYVQSAAIGAGLAIFYMAMKSIVVLITALIKRQIAFDHFTECHSISDFREAASPIVDKAIELPDWFG